MGVKQSLADPHATREFTQYEGHQVYEAIGNSMGYVGAGFNPPFFYLCGSIPRSLLRNDISPARQSPSFPHAFSGNPGGMFGLDPR